MRKLLLIFSIIVVGIVFIIRLFYLQIYNQEAYSLFKDSAIRVVYEYPDRGHIFDRNGTLLVSNQPSYDVMIIPKNVKPLDTVEFCKLLKISKYKFRSLYKKAYNYSPILPSVFVPQLSKKDYAPLQEKMRKYTGFYVQKRSLRNYKTKIGANVLGSIGKVNNSTITNDPYYSQGDLIGKEGVEASYEKFLRGVKGVKFIQKDRFNKDIGSFKDGVYDTVAKPGKDLYITIDAALQDYGETLMKNKRGGIVAIEPKSGEILALISAPTYDPNLLVGRKRSYNYKQLHNDTISKPLFDRSLKGQYPPGSPFKVLNALIALQENVVTPTERFTCNLGYYYNNKKLIGCHRHQSPTNMNSGIYQSCNAYFVNVYRRIIDKYNTPAKGLDAWYKHVKSFGLGDYLNNDLYVGATGRIPNTSFYNRMYGDNRWSSTFIASNAIGQGEVETTPIQLANMAAAIANRGYFYTPHIIKQIENDTIDSKFKIPKHTTIDKTYFEPIIEGMLDVYNNGTAMSLKVKDIEICGKTGTAENFIKINGKKVQLKDHSIFVAFAPKNNPKIALAVFVENGYWGSRYAGKIASLMIEKYINNKITRTDLEDWILTHSLEEEYAKPYSGKPFSITD